MPEPLLALDGVRKSFGRVVVADEIDLRVDAGETVGIVGPNGAGKTSLFAVITGDLRPDRGAVVFRGKDVTRQSVHQRCRHGMGRTYQVPRPFERMTVYENVLVSVQEGASLSGSAARQRAGRMLDKTALLDVANVRAGRLTLLNRKRLELARALATDPAVLLLDEVAGGLTEPEVAELVDVVRRLHDEGIAVVWIEHVVQALTATVSRLICLSGGRFVAEGAPEAVLRDPVVRELYFGTGPQDDPEQTQGS